MSDPIRSLEAILRGRAPAAGEPGIAGAPRLRSINVVQALLVEIDEPLDAPDADAADADVRDAGARAVTALVLLTPPAAGRRHRQSAPPVPHVSSSAAGDAVRDRFGLSPREAAVARLVASGLSNRDVASSLGLSPYTARNHTARVLAKTGTRSRARLAALFGEIDAEGR